MRNVTPYLAVLTTCLSVSLLAGPPPSDQPRMALVIANVTYHDPRLGSLPSSVLVGTVHLCDVLKGAGFKIYNDGPLVNLTHEAMEGAFKGFATAAPENALVVVYYAGHGAEHDALNYLIPVEPWPSDSASSTSAKTAQPGSLWGRLRGAKSSPPASSEGDAGESRGDVRLKDLLDALHPRHLTSIVILDTCRTPENTSPGMGEPSEFLPNSLIAFPTKQGASANPDSAYTDALVRHLRDPISIEDVFQKTRNDVVRATNNTRNPHESGTLGQKVYIVQPAGELAEGQLMTSETYYVLSHGRKRRIPDSASFEALGFNAGFAVKRSTDELSKIPDGDAYPGIASNVLESKTCRYYLFWGMKWCLPPSPDPLQFVPPEFQKDGPVRALLSGESAAIGGGDLARLPNGVNIHFKDSTDVYRSGGGSFRLLDSTERNALSPSLIVDLPAFMHHPLLEPREPDFNQLSGSLVVADPSRHQIFFARGSVVVASDLLGKGVLGANEFKPGMPGLMVLAEKKGWLLVADSEQHMIHIIDTKSHQRLDDIPQDFPTLITGLALSPDEQRLYVANQGGETVARNGSISVFELTGKHQLVSRIGGVNCPEGMSITPNGDQIYVASQCGSGNDPVFVIDTSTEAVTAIPGFPVGHNVVVTPALEKAYVSRVDYPAVDAGKVVKIPAQVSVIDTSRKKLLGSWPVDLHSFAVTPDGNYVLAIGGLQMVVIDARNDQVINEVQFETPPAGVTVATTNDGKDVMCYVWLPKTPRLFFSGLGELLKSPSH